MEYNGIAEFAGKHLATGLVFGFVVYLIGHYVGLLRDLFGR